MSDLLNKASLVVIPSGYKEDTVYSVVPSDGSGDLSFTRASNGTRINSAGLVEVCPWNLLQYSEEITNAAWGEFGASRSANTTTAPNGTTTADTILPSATTATHGIFQQITVAGGIYSASAYFKANGYNYACIRIATNSDTTRYGVVISLIDGSVTATDSSGSPTNTSYSIETAGNGWFKLNVSCSHSSGFIYHTVGVSNVAVPTFSNSLPSFTANGTSSIFIWGAQLNIGSTAKPYFPTTDRLNVPRLTYQNGGGECPSLLLEKQSTNLLPYSQDFSYWTIGSLSRTVNSTISPDGTQNATQIIPNTTNASHPMYYVYNIGAACTYSVFFKSSGYNYAQIYGGNATSDVGRFSVVMNLTTGAIDTSDNVTSSDVKIENFGNGWWRISVYYSGFTGTSTFMAVTSIPQSGMSRNSYLDIAYTGNGTDGIYVWGAQCEQSSYVTSYIPSNGSSATRVADACYKTGISSLIGQTEGVVFLDVVINGQSNLTQPINIYNNNFSADTISTIAITYSNGDVGAFAFRGNGTFTNIACTATGYNIGDRLKIAYRYKSGDFALYINGVQKATSNSTLTFVGTKSELYLGAETVYYAYKDSIKLNEFVQFPTAFTNAELQALTTI